MFFWDIENTKAYNNKMGRYKTKYVLNFINKYVKNSMRILDIGGGSGRFAIPLYERGHDILLIDKSNEAADVLSKRCSGIKYIIDNFENVEFDPRSEKFDLIIIIEVLLYFKDWSKTFGKLYNLLKDDGVIIFTATNKYSWRFLLKQMLKNKQDYTVLSLNEYYKILKQNNFIVDRIEGFLWIPCKLDSNSIFVNIFSFIEKKIYLNSYISQSPWLLFAIKKDIIKESTAKRLVRDFLRIRVGRNH